MTGSSPCYWIAIASAEHVARGVELGIMQVCHGKGGRCAGSGLATA